MANSDETKKKVSTTNKKKNSTGAKSTAKKTSTSSKSTAKKASTKKSTSTKQTEKKEPIKQVAIVQEENHFGRTLIAAVVIVLIFLAGYFGIKYKKNGGTSEVYKMSVDEKRFKNEYEVLNGTTRENGDKIKDVTIKEENHITYIDAKEAAKILDTGSGIIYFGYAACPGCRNFVPVLIDAANASGVDKIYYVDIRQDDKDSNDIRDIYALNERKRPSKIKDATDEYLDIKLILANYIEEYVLTTEEGKKVSTGEKRLYAPTLVAVKNGEVVGHRVGTVKDENENANSLTDDDEKNLFNAFTSIFNTYLGNGCQEDGC